MRNLNFLLVLAAVPLLACAHGAQSTPTPEGPPTVREGLTNASLATIALPADFDMAKGRTLRMRELTIAPHGSLPMHSHTDRPAVAYVVRGELTVYPEDGGAPQVMQPGQAYSAFEQGHAFRNTGTQDAIVIEVDLPAGGQ